jgi:hypothetical protein
LLEVPVIVVTKGASEIFSEDISSFDVKSIIPEIDSYLAQFVYRDQEFEEFSGQDASMWFRYTPINITGLPVWVGIEIGPTKSCLHPWEVCLIDVKYRRDKIPTVTEIDRRDIQLLENPPINARYFVYHSEKEGRTQVTLYWYTQSTFLINQEYIKKWAKISLISYIESPETYSEVEDYLLPFSMEIVNHWYPTSKWSNIVSAFSLEGTVSLLFVDLLILFIVSLFLINKKREERIQSRLLYTRLQKSQDAALLNTISNLGNKKTTLDNITLTYNDEYKTNTSMEDIYDKLSSAEKIGILNKSLFNDEGKPNYYYVITHNDYLNRLYNSIFKKDYKRTVLNEELGDV